MHENDKLAQLVAAGCIDEKATDVTILDVQELTTITDYMVIATARNIIQAQSICDFVKELLADQGKVQLRRDGYQEGQWIIADFNEVMLHVFLEEVRRKYDLEGLWSDARKVSILEA